MHNITAIIIVKHRTVQIQTTPSDLVFKNYFSLLVYSLVILPKRYPFLFPPWVPDVRSLSPCVISTPTYVP